MNSKKYITKGDGLPNWENPISHAVVANNMCFVSGQLSVNSEGKYVCETALKEGELAFKNFFSVIENAGFKKEDIVFIDIAFDNLENLPEINQLYSSLFLVDKRPARTIYEVQKLPFGAKIKIAGTAVKDL
ncbi:RidA family protein [Flavobacterium sp.]|uniref:RidA family protein n=1 Tax=Flavobacterium sp. TaxID=239 RepID=UPI003267BE18